MKVVVKMTIPGEPISKARPRLARAGHTYTPQRTIDAEQNIAWEVRKKYPRLRPDGTSRFSVCAVFYRKTRRRSDIDNLQKLLFDALNGIVWEDDDQICEVNAFKQTDPARPRTELIIIEL